VKSKYICLSCKSFLMESDNVLFCESCNIQWAKKDEIPIFLKNDFYWGEIPQELMKKINNELEDNKWNDVIDENLTKDYPHMIKYIIDDTRADFRVLLPLNKNSTILDVGCGWGSLTIPLAKFYDKVYAFDGIKERVEFVKHRIKQENLQNVDLFMSDFGEIPLPESSMDAIILNGILEWSALKSPIKNPKKAQINFLEQMLHILKPGGCIYIGIENRFGYPYFLGHIDHSGLKYTSLFPRLIVNIYIKIINKLQKEKIYRTSQASYRAYTYSYKGYKKLLSKAGFSKIELNTPIFTYNDYRHIVSLNNLKSLVFYIRNLTRGISIKKRIFRILLGNRIGAYLFRRVTYCYSIIAIKGADH